MSDKWQVLEERTGASASSKIQYVWGTRYEDVLALRDSFSGETTTRMYSMADYFQPTALADTTGTVRERYVYRAFGDVSYYSGSFAAQAASSYFWSYLYGSYYLDLQTKLYQVRNRYYHTALGRWLSRDPLEDAELSQGANLYWYVSNNAVNAVDPSGLTWVQGTDFQLETPWTLKSWTAQWTATGTPDIGLVASVTGTYTATVSVDCTCNGKTQYVQGTKTYTAPPDKLPMSMVIPQTNPALLPAGFTTAANSISKVITIVTISGAEAGATSVVGTMAAKGANTTLSTMLNSNPFIDPQDQTAIIGLLNEDAPTDPSSGTWSGTPPCNALN